MHHASTVIPYVLCNNDEQTVYSLVPVLSWYQCKSRKVNRMLSVAMPLITLGSNLLLVQQTRPTSDMSDSAVCHRPVRWPANLGFTYLFATECQSVAYSSSFSVWRSKRQSRWSERGPVCPHNASRALSTICLIQSDLQTHMVKYIHTGTRTDTHAHVNTDRQPFNGLFSMTT